ncbi:MAG: hypothetical protein HYW89_04135 [Candidatus Sungiibacteriota bacterium]|uniref:Glycosyltransferase RgtA/B/C/D-like domain-containing protein n=1 Tax=Candidatus Sungiibacteriota bacterium TaxID=2750080 RepID=A0A7T5RJB3_9BACT|nr:MAG: hypothetical protein HYW89_04135 [Candidatus Sungbacteria bacterium]
MSKRTGVLLILLGILALGAFFRFYLITEIPLGLYPDEAMNGNNALEALATGDFKTFYPENNGREGLFINLQAIALGLFGNVPWALRIVSAFFGTLTILGIFLLTRELLRLKSNFNHERSERSSTSIALLTSFFLAVSFWHINFSRIGFRAIMVPFFASFALYFLLKGLRTGKLWSIIAAGIFTGLGFHTYIAFRFMPFVLAVPIIIYLIRWWKNKETNCIPCLVALFLLVNILVGLPLALYFFENPQDFIGRAGEVSVFSAKNQALEFVKSNAKTLGMFFVPGGGDCNWRHNFDCQPFLPYGILATIGILALSRLAPGYQGLTLIAWLFFMSLPATLTREGLPHALRSIGMIPPIMILSGFGSWWIYHKVKDWLEKQKIKWPQYTGQLERIKKEVFILGMLTLLFIPLYTFQQYFVQWAYNPNSYFAFSTDIWHLGQYLNGLPNDVKKYVVVNMLGVDIRGIPAPTQTVMFATNTFRKKERMEKNITYIPYRDETSMVSAIEVLPQQKTVIAFLNGGDRKLIKNIQEKFEGLKIKVPGDFVILVN